MGINGLWDILGPGQLISIAALSTEHFQRTGRPFRIAIDEPGWRFNNLNDCQVAIIRAKEGASNPIEKHILYRLSKLLRLNIQPIFILDGPGRPWKRGKRGGNRVDYDRTRLLLKMLDQLRIPHHLAPAEAEAECAALQQAGVVDAVWSDDGDTLMFGATVLVREHREGADKRNGGRKSDTHVRVWRAEDLRAECGLSPRDLVVFTLLSGGDYNLAGLPGCGPAKAWSAMLWRECLLSKLLLCVGNYELALWRSALAECFNELGINVHIPYDFPQDLVVRNYRCPKVSTEDQLHDLRSLRQGWDRPVNEATLRPFLRDHFNFHAKAYITHIVPLLLVRKLCAGLSSDEKARYGLRMAVKKKSKKAQAIEAIDQFPLETKITYVPTAVSALALGVQPIEEDWKALTTKKDGVFDPHKRQELDLLNVLLDAGLGETHYVHLLAAVQDPSDTSLPKEPITKMGDIETRSAADNVRPKRKAGSTSIARAPKTPKSALAADIASGRSPCPSRSQAPCSSPVPLKPSGLRLPMTLDEIMGTVGHVSSPPSRRLVPALSRCTTMSSDTSVDAPSVSIERSRPRPLLRTVSVHTPKVATEAMASAKPVLIDLTLD